MHNIPYETHNFQYYTALHYMHSCICTYTYRKEMGNGKTVGCKITRKPQNLFQKMLFPFPLSTTRSVYSCSCYKDLMLPVRSISAQRHDICKHTHTHAHMHRQQERACLVYQANFTTNVSCTLTFTGTYTHMHVRIHVSTITCTILQWYAKNLKQYVGEADSRNRQNALQQAD